MADIRQQLGYSTPTPNRPASVGSAAESYAAQKDKQAKDLAAAGDTRGAMDAAQARNTFMMENGQAYKAPNPAGSALTSTPLDVPKTSTMNIAPTPGGALGMDKTQTGQITANTPLPQQAAQPISAPVVDQLPTGQSGMTPPVQAPTQPAGTQPQQSTQQSQTPQGQQPTGNPMLDQVNQATGGMIGAANNYFSYGQKAAQDVYDTSQDALRYDAIAALGGTNAAETVKSMGLTLEDMSWPQLQQLMASNGLAPKDSTIQRIKDEGAAAIDSVRMERGDQEAVVKFSQDQLARTLGRAVTDTEKFNAVQDIKLRNAMAVFGGGSSDAGSNMAVLKQAEEGRQKLNDLASEYAGRLDLNARDMQAVIRTYGEKERQINNQVTDTIQAKYAEIQSTMKELRKQGVTNMKDLQTALLPLNKEYVGLYSDALKWQAEQTVGIQKEANAEAERIFRRGLDMDKQIADQTGKAVINGQVLTDDQGNEIPTIDGLYKMSQIDGQRSELEGIVYMNGQPVIRNGQYVPTADIMKFDTQEARLNRALDQEQAQFEDRLGFDIGKEEFNQMMETARFSQDVDEFNQTMGLNLDKFEFEQLKAADDRRIELAKNGLTETTNVDVNRKTSSFNPAGSKYGVSAVPGGIQVNTPTKQEGGRIVLTGDRRQCGEYVNDVLGIPGFFTNMFSEKKKQVSMSNPPVPGSAFLLDKAQPYGHVGVIEKVNPDGTMTISESNYDGNESFRRLDNVSVSDLQKRGLVGFTGGLSQQTQIEKSPTAAKGKQLGETQVKMLSDAKFLPDVLGELDSIVKGEKAAFGPIQGSLRSMNPYDTEQQAAGASLKRATQLIGSFMEGGVLRKEDEEKYSKMLPQLTDTKDVAQRKLDDVKRMLELKRQGYIQDFSTSGYDTSGLQTPMTSSSKSPSDRVIEAVTGTFFDTLKRK